MQSSRGYYAFAILFFLAVNALASNAQTAYFPPKAFGDDSWSDKFKADWYSHELEVLEEPSLFETAKNTHSESYRFLWLRTFHHPIAIRLELRSDGTGALTTKVVNGEAGFLRKNNHLTENVSRPLTREQIQTFLTKIKDLEFWALPNPVHDEAGVDGAQWIIEGVKDGKYHTEGPVRELGLMLALGIAQMNIPKDEIF